MCTFKQAWNTHIFVWTLTAIWPASIHKCSKCNSINKCTSLHLCIESYSDMGTSVSPQAMYWGSDNYNSHPQVAHSPQRSQTGKWMFNPEGERLEADTKLQRSKRIPHPFLTYPPPRVFLGSHTHIPMRLAITPDTGRAPSGNCLQNHFILCPGKWALLFDNYTLHTCPQPFLRKQAGMTSQNPATNRWQKTLLLDSHPPAGPGRWLPLFLHTGLPAWSLFPWMLTWQAIHFMNMTLRGESPSQQPPNYVIIVIKELKEELGG